MTRKPRQITNQRRVVALALSRSSLFRQVLISWLTRPDLLGSSHMLQKSREPRLAGRSDTGCCVALAWAVFLLATGPRFLWP
jgi:hypothetical protein